MTHESQPSREADDRQAGEPAAEDASGELEPDFTRLGLESTPVEGEVGAEPTFAPTDPVFGVDEHGRPQVVGGFGTDSMESIEVEPSAEDSRPGDEALKEAVERELNEDGATTGLSLEVFVRRGVVHLRGRVPGMEDVDNAESVAARVPGVVEVLDELEVATI
ncbi:MAG TPA: BON domain-containing protein [Chloroflexota bacterium]